MTNPISLACHRPRCQANMIWRFFSSSLWSYVLWPPPPPKQLEPKRSHPSLVPQASQIYRMRQQDHQRQAIMHLIYPLDGGPKCKRIPTFLPRVMLQMILRYSVTKVLLSNGVTIEVLQGPVDIWKDRLPVPTMYVNINIRVCMTAWVNWRQACQHVHGINGPL